MLTIRCALLVAILSLLAVGLHAQHVSTSYTLSSKYVSRGLNTVNNWVLQTDVSLQLGNFTLSLWGNMELTNHNAPLYVRSKPAGTFTEWNLIAEYATARRGVQLAIGWIEYEYPGTGWERTREAYASLSWERPFPLSIALYQDLKAAQGAYLTLGGEIPLSGGWSVRADVGYGTERFNAYHYGSPAASWVDLTVGLTTQVELGRGWSVKPALWFSTLLDRRLLADAPNRQNIWMSVELSYSR
ncbi:MAG: TorF family putative porin [Armatimonadota bacterium]|nr:TorF family putative porin [Armatimonadota bacterium]